MFFERIVILSWNFIFSIVSLNIAKIKEIRRNHEKTKIKNDKKITKMIFLLISTLHLLKLETFFHYFQKTPNLKIAINDINSWHCDGEFASHEMTSCTLKLKNRRWWSMIDHQIICPFIEWIKGRWKINTHITQGNLRVHLHLTFPPTFHFFYLVKSLKM